MRVGQDRAELGAIVGLRGRPAYDQPAPSAPARARARARPCAASRRPTPASGLASISVPMLTTVVPSPLSTSTDICATSSSASRNSRARLEAVGGRLGERGRHQLVHRRRQLQLRQLRRRRRLLVADLVGDRLERALERLLAGQKLVEHDAAREEVGARVGFEAAALLGRHVRRRADHHARRASGSTCRRARCRSRRP